jgi:hypothetical protein
MQPLSCFQLIPMSQIHKLRYWPEVHHHFFILDKITDAMSFVNYVV